MSLNYDEFELLVSIEDKLRDIGEFLRVLLASDKNTPESTPSIPENISLDPSCEVSDPVSDVRLAYYNPLSKKDQDTLGLS